MPDPYREPIDEPLAATKPLAQELSVTQNKEQVAMPEIEKAPSSGQIEKATEPEILSASIPGALAPAATAVAQTAQKIKSYEKNQQLKALVDLAFEKGVAYAADVARKLENPYIIDEFHDILVDELHKELVQKGKLEDI